MASKDASFVARREKLEDDLKALQKQIYDFEEAYYGMLCKSSPDPWFIYLFYFS